MSVGEAVGSMIRGIDRRLGVLAWLRGEPRPPAGGFDLDGEKFLDWGWVCINLPPGPKRALEIGSGQSPVIPAMLGLGYDVVAIDLCTDLSKHIAGFTFLKGDFNKMPLEPGFDVIVACSTLEHIGLSGRFGSDEQEAGDLAAMRKIADLLNPEGLVFLTIPVGEDGTYKPWHRVYGRDRLPRLLERFRVVTARFFVKEPWGPWRKASQDAALSFSANASRYALAEMILRREDS